MSKRQSIVLVVIVLVAVIGLAAGGASWLWHMLLRMHGVH
jgi:hypothetical protein